MKRQTFQRGTVTLKKRELGPDVWSLRFSEGGKYKSVRLGSKETIPTKALAEKKANEVRRDRADLRHTAKIEDAVVHFLEENMSDRHSTSASYRTYLNRIRKEWGSSTAGEMARDLVSVERWVNDLKKQKKPADPVSKKTRMHMKATLHLLFESIMRQGELDIQRNPMSLIRVKGTNQMVRPQVIISIEQYRKLLDDDSLPVLVKVMIQVAMCLGLRVSELLALRWDDVDYGTNLIFIRRGIVGKHLGNVKTLSSEEELPLHENLRKLLKTWKNVTPDVNGWLFGNPITGRPYHADSLRADYLMPAGQRVGVPRLGWHAFRHTYRALLRDLELPLEVQQKLMRHSDIRTTSLYGGKKMAGLKAANAQLVESLGTKKEDRYAG